MVSSMFNIMRTMVVVLFRLLIFWKKEGTSIPPFLLCPILRGKHAGVTPILRIYLVDDDMDVFRLLTEVLH